MKPACKLFQLFRNARVAILLCSVLLVSCSDGITSAGIGGTGISYGTTTDFGSIVVNGSDLDDSSAIVTLDGNPGDTSVHGGIKLGMVVRVSGTFSGNTGTASSIEYRDNLEGEVCSISSVGGITTLRVLGQTVILDATTIIDNNATITLGDIIEVSGLPDDLEQIHASFVEVKNTATEVEVKGQVDTVVDSTLTINDLTVNFSTAVTPDGTPTPGQFVEVKGARIDFACGPPDTLMATSVELEPEGAGDIPAGSHAEVEGFITILTSNGFKIGSSEVVITTSTRYLPEGFFVGDIVVGAKVEVEGSFDNGVLTATKIVFRENVRLESDVASGDNSSFELVDLPGIVITTNSATNFNNGIIIVPGVSHIRVRGIEGPNNTVLATRIDDRSGSLEAFLQGPVESKVGTVISVLGIEVNATSLTVFQDVNEVPISLTTFLDLVQPGTLVKFQGTLAGSIISYEEAELEDD